MNKSLRNGMILVGFLGAVAILFLGKKKAVATLESSSAELLKDPPVSTTGRSHDLAQSEFSDGLLH